VTNTKTTSGNAVTDAAGPRAATAALTARLRAAEPPEGPEAAEVAEQLGAQATPPTPDKTLLIGLLSTLKPSVAGVASLATPVAATETGVKTLRGIG
jgi:hypothetical protein